MAGNVAVKNESSARAWVAKANELNAQCKSANERVSQILKMIETDSEGDMVVKLVEAGNSMLEASEEIFNAMNGIAEAINGMLDSILSIAAEVASKIVSIIGS